MNNRYSEKFFLASLIAFSSALPAQAQGLTNYDLSDTIQTGRGNQFQSSGNTGEFGRDSMYTKSQAYSDTFNHDYSGTTQTQSPISRGRLKQTATALLAPDTASIDPEPIPSATFKYGFAQVGGQLYRGVANSRRGTVRSSTGAMLPPTSTASVDLNICDLPFLRRNLGYPNAYSPPGALEVAGGPVVLPSSPPYSPSSFNNGGKQPGGNPAGFNNGYVANAPAYRYTADGGYMTGAGIIAYPNGTRVSGGPQFMYKSGYGYSDMRNPAAGWSWDPSAPYRNSVL